MTTPKFNPQQIAAVEKQRDEAREQWRMSSVCRELQAENERLKAQLDAARADSQRLAKAAEEVLFSYIIGKRVEAGHPCPENMVICRELRAAIDAAMKQEGRE